jgi:cobalamin biosynthesis protein CobT
MASESIKVQIPDDKAECRLTLGDTFFSSDKEFHTLQCSRARTAADISRSGILTRVNQDLIELEFQNSEPKPNDQEESYFRGGYKSSKLECVIIYDGPERGFRIEKLSGSAKGLKAGTKPPDSALNNLQMNVDRTKRKSTSPLEKDKRKKTNTDVNAPLVNMQFAQSNLPRTVESESDSSDSDSDDQEMLNMIMDNDSNETPQEEYKEDTQFQNTYNPLPLQQQMVSNNQQSQNDDSLFSSSSSSDSSDSSSSSSSDSDSEKETTQQPTLGM